MQILENTYNSSVLSKERVEEIHYRGRLSTTSNTVNEVLFENCPINVRETAWEFDMFHGSFDFGGPSVLRS